MQNCKTKREVIKMVLDGQKPPYVPWSFKFTQEPKEQLQKYAFSRTRCSTGYSVPNISCKVAETLSSCSATSIFSSTSLASSTKAPFPEFSTC